MQATTRVLSESQVDSVFGSFLYVLVLQSADHDSS